MSENGEVVSLEVVQLFVMMPEVFVLPSPSGELVAVGVGEGFFGVEPVGAADEGEGAVEDGLGGSNIGVGNAVVGVKAV